MSRDVIDRALSDEPRITPTPDFCHRVMRSVRQEADRRRGLAFPWLPLAAGAAISTSLAIAGVVTGEAPAQIAPPAVLATLSPALAWLLTSLTASLGLAWWSLRFARG